eukprot:scaffold662635_cov128-Prasinocladus_malaysianus.AAC.1
MNLLISRRLKPGNLSENWNWLEERSWEERAVAVGKDSSSTRRQVVAAECKWLKAYSQLPDVVLRQPDGSNIDGKRGTQQEHLY